MRFANDLQIQSQIANPSSRRAYSLHASVNCNVAISTCSDLIDTKERKKMAMNKLSIDSLVSRSDPF